MTSNVFIRSGHGYENHSTQGRCTAFDGFEIIANPLGGFDKAARESRVFRRPGGNGTDYGSHAIKLGKANFDGALYILMQHGGGREVWRIPQFYDGGDLAEHILAMPERLQYSLLYSIYSIASEARIQAQGETRAEWSQAIADGRIRKKRATKTRGARVEIIQQWEVDLKAGQSPVVAAP